MAARVAKSVAAMFLGMRGPVWGAGAANERLVQWGRSLCMRVLVNLVDDTQSSRDVVVPLLWHEERPLRPQLRARLL